VRGSCFLPLSDPLRDVVSDPDSTAEEEFGLGAFLLLPLDEDLAPGAPPRKLGELEDCLLGPRVLTETEGFFSSFFTGG